MRLEGKVAIITGGASGMGAEECRIFAREGAKVVIADVSEDLGRQVEAEIAESGGDAVFMHLDVTSEDNLGCGGECHSGALWEGGHPGEQCGNQRHAPPGYDEHRGVGYFHGHQCQGRIPRDEERDPADAGGRRRLHREHIVHQRHRRVTSEIIWATTRRRARCGS